jgi:hypothetical protein
MERNDHGLDFVPPSTRRTDRDHFSRELFRDSDYEIVECTTVRRVFYAAVRTKSTSEVWALIVLVHRNPGSEFNFTYKDMSETMGPVEASAQAKVLDALSPTTNEYALEWRQKCRDRLTSRAAIRSRLKAVQVGSIIRVPRPLRFTDGREASRFECLDRGRSGLRWLALTADGDQFTCNLGRDWATELQWEIEPAQTAQGLTLPAPPPAEQATSALTPSTDKVATG